MRAAFAATFYWIALTLSADRVHGRAVALSRAFRSSVPVTTDEVLSGYPAFFSGIGRGWRIKAEEVVADLIESEHVLIVGQSRASFLAELALYRARPDKAYSLTDCVSMETMRQHRLADVLTNDHHFEQEGFRALLRDQ